MFGSLLNNPGHCPAPPKATQLPSPALTPWSLPSPCHQPGTRSYSHREGTLQQNGTALQISPPLWAKPPAPSLTLSQPVSGGDKHTKSGWLQDLCAKRAQIYRHFNARTFLSKCNLWGKEGTTFVYCHLQPSTFQAGQESHSPSRALPPTPPNPVYAPSDSPCPQRIG